MATYYSVFTVTPTWHTLSLWSALCCLLVSSAVSVANRLAKLLLQTITKELTLQCATRRGFCEVFSFVRSFCLSTALQRAVFTSSRQLRYEQAKHVDGLQCDSWILLKCFRSRVMAGSPWWPSWTLLKTKTPIVGYPDTYRFDPYCRTALGVQRDLVKSLSTLYQSLHRHLATCWHNEIYGHAQMFITVQHLLVFWLIL